VIAWQSMIDSTVGARGVFDSVFGTSSTGEQHELVLFDVKPSGPSFDRWRLLGSPGLPQASVGPSASTCDDGWSPTSSEASDRVVMRRRTPWAGRAGVGGD